MAHTRYEPDQPIELDRMQPVRVVVVGETPDAIAVYASAMQPAADVTVLADVAELVPRLLECEADLVLLDVTAGSFDDLEIVAAIRRHEGLVGVSIVALASASQQGRRWDAIAAGCDDFLAQPIAPDHLVAAVLARARRARTLRSLMMRDGLTGLLNQSRTQERLGLEIVRADRQNGRLALALVDIDRFKAVNDTYGHPAGDRVLKTLSRAFEGRLRRTDVIGRYGGDEFAAILLDTDGANAARVLDEIRDGFGRLRHEHEDREFSVTFSGGVATYPQWPDAASLIAAADRALYDAKHAGGNRIRLAAGGG